MEEKDIKNVVNDIITDEPAKDIVVNELKDDVSIVVEKKADTITVNVANSDDVILDVQPESMSKKEKIVSTIWTIVNIVSNIAFLFFLSDVLSGFIFVGGLGYVFTTSRIIGIVLFAIAQISGVILFAKFFSRQKLKTKLVLASMPLTLVLLGGGWLVLNIDNFDGENESYIKESLNLDTFDPSTIDFKYVIIATAIYLVLLYLIYGIIVKRTKKSKQNHTNTKK